MNKRIKEYTSNLPLMEAKYCSSDDYTFVQERLKYEFVKKDHYAIR